MDLPMTSSDIDVHSSPTVLSRMSANPRIIGVGTAVSGTSITQPELLGVMGVTDAKVQSVYLNSAIRRRHLTLPPADEHGQRIAEPQGDLLDKHKKLAVEMGAQALQNC